MKVTQRDGGGPTSLQRTMDRVNARLEKKKKDEQEKLAAEGYSKEAVESITLEGELMQSEAAKGDTKASDSSRGTSPLRLIEQGQLNLLEGEMRGDYTQVPITPGNEYPKILTRIGLFPPTQKKTAIRDLDDELAWRFKTGWGTGRKFGAPLTIYDEDTLLALGALRQMQLKGKGSKMPVKVMNPFETAADTSVDVLYTTVGEIQRYLKQAKGGRGNKKRLASIKRLASVTLEFTAIADKKTNDAIKAKTFSTKIIDLLTEELSTDSALYVQFPPVMVKWLHESYTYINMNVRRELRGDTAKAIHRHLSSQTKFNIGAAKFRNVLEYKRAMKYFVADLKDAMEQLEAMGWCEWDLTGSSRSKSNPLVLIGRRLRDR